MFILVVREEQINTHMIVSRDPPPSIASSPSRRCCLSISSKNFSIVLLYFVFIMASYQYILKQISRCCRMNIGRCFLRRGWWRRKWRFMSFCDNITGFAGGTTMNLSLASFARSGASQSFVFVAATGCSIHRRRRL